MSQDNQVFFEHNPIENMTPAKTLLANAFDAYLNREGVDFYRMLAWQLSVIVADRLVVVEDENVLSTDDVAKFFTPGNLYKILTESDHKYADDLDTSRKDKDHFLFLFGGFFNVLAEVQINTTSS